jgi:sialate O-acetylesterase
MFADHAVLQRDQPIRIYGQAPSGSEIRVQLGGANASTRAAANGQWQATLPAMPAGGPYTLQVTGGGQSQQAGDILIGDVFLCTGQSNMQLSVRRAANADAEIAAATDSAVRELAIDRVPSPLELATFQHARSPGRWSRPRPPGISRRAVFSSPASCASM